MRLPVRVRYENHEHGETRRNEPTPAEMVPFGRYGGGQWTGHPIGLVVVIGLLMTGLVGLPEFRWFFVVSLVLSGILGIILWQLHRRTCEREKLRGNRRRDKIPRWNYG